MSAMTEMQLLTPAQVGKILGVTPSTLCRLRQEGKGPRFVWVTDHTPRYREDELLAYIEERAS
jgi:predicted DNA-binding transcriptional regulator AlpA